MARGRRSQPVNRHWTGFSGSSLAFAAGVGGATIIAAQHDRETILRTRGTLLAFVDALQAPASLAQISVGFALVPEGTGSTVLWSPLTDADAPWFYYSTFFLGYEEYVVDVIDSPVLTAYREIIDSKAMRRVRNQEVQLVVENTTIAGAVSVNIVAAGRMLNQE